MTDAARPDHRAPLDAATALSGIALTATALSDIARRADLPAALRQAAAACLSRGNPRPTDLSLAAALASPDGQPLATALLALDAIAVLPDGQRVPFADLLAPDEPATPVAFFLAPAGPASGGAARSVYREAKAGQATIGLALAIEQHAGRITAPRAAIGGLAPRPLRLHQVEATLQGRRPTAALQTLAAETARGELQPSGGGAITDQRRLDLVRALCADALAALLAAGGAAGIQSPAAGRATLRQHNPGPTARPRKEGAGTP